MLSEQPRLSINGWFHSTRRLEPKRPKVETIERFVPSAKCKLAKVVAKDFLSEKRQTEVQQTFSDSSELNLEKFLVQGTHDEIYSELSSNPSFFETVGPVSKRHVARLKENNIQNLPSTRHILECLKSKNFARLAAKLTGVTVAGAETSVKVSRVEHGTYWVLGDEDAEQSATDGYCLDVHVFVQKTAWEDSAGGELIYVEEGDTEEVSEIKSVSQSALDCFVQLIEVYRPLFFFSSSASRRPQMPLRSFSVSRESSRS